MAAHHSIVSSLRVTIRGRPVSARFVEGGILPAGTIGILEKSGVNAWTSEVEYSFYPNNFTETLSEFRVGGTIVVLKNDVLCRLVDNQPTVVSIAEAGFMRINHIHLDPGVNLCNLDRCEILFYNDKFMLVPVNVDNATHWFVGRMLHKTASQSPLLYADFGSTHDLEFFRQCPLPGEVVGSKRNISEIVNPIFKHPDRDSDSE